MDRSRISGLAVAVAVGARLLDSLRRPLVVAADALNTAASAAVQPIFVVPLMVAAVMSSSPSSSQMIGTVVAICLAAWLAPQLLAGPTAWRWLPASWPSWLLGLRAGMAMLLAYVLVSQAGGGTVLLNSLTQALAAFWVLGGLLATGQPAGLVSDLDETTSGQSWHLLVSGTLVVLVGLFLARLLGPEGPLFPGWAVQVLIWTTLGLAVAAVLAWRTAPEMVPVTVPAWSALPLVPALLTHGARLRRYVTFRAMMGLAMLADPFYLLYGFSAFDVPVQSLGIYLALFGLVRLTTGLAFPTLIAAGYARPLSQSAALARVLIPLLMLTLPLILRSSAFSSRLPVDAGWIGPVAFGALVVLYGLAAAGLDATDAAYLRDALAANHRPAVRGLFLVLLIVLSLAFVLGGAILDRWGMTALLVVAAGISLLAILASGLLLEVPPAETRDLSETGALPTYRAPGRW